MERAPVSFSASVEKQVVSAQGADEKKMLKGILEATEYFIHYNNQADEMDVILPFGELPADPPVPLVNFRCLLAAFPKMLH